MSDPSEPAAKPARKGGMFWKLLALGFLACVITAEVLLALIFLPKGASSAHSGNAAEVAPAADEHGHEAAMEDSHGEAHAGGHADPHAEPAAEHGEEHADPAESHEDESAHGEHGAADAEHGEEAAHSGGGHGGHGGAREVDLGEYSCSAFQPAMDTTLLVSFHLYGTVDVAAEHDFGPAFESNQHRIRDQVLTSVRSAVLTELTDPELTALKRQLLARVNRLLGRDLLQRVVFSDFVIVER